jgi:hypothetical protein
VCSGSDNPLRDPESFFIARRSLPDGATTWLLPGLPAATALETDDAGTTVFATLVAGRGLPGTLIALDAATGRPLWRVPLHVDGWPTTATSLACAAPDRLLVGTACGRILDLDLDATAEGAPEVEALSTSFRPAKQPPMTARSDEEHRSNTV